MEIGNGRDDVREDNLRRLMTQYKNDLMRMCVAFLKDSALAEDAVQETFVKAYKALDAFRGDCGEKTWLMRIALNTCRSYRRDRWFRFVDRSVTPEELCPQAADSGDRDLLETVMGLPYHHREVVLLYYYQGMSIQEIAQTLGLAASTVSVRLQKARRKLRIDWEGGQEHD
ncbi:MAG: sigma-70 family RNA polymerase sigma factor [Eubacteriales bacterium]|nr:sigma-70 family RNA polymerase sigma factor [Eubacteriales bacterium]